MHVPTRRDPNTRLTISASMLKQPWAAYKRSAAMFDGLLRRRTADVVRRIFVKTDELTELRFGVETIEELRGERLRVRLRVVDRLFELEVAVPDSAKALGHLARTREWTDRKSTRLNSSHVSE